MSEKVANLFGKVTKKEKTSYASYFVGQNIYYLLLLMFLIPYFTDIGIPAASVAVLTLIVKVWDAINDPIFGGIVDRIKFKKGKFVPWLRISIFAIPISTILLFSIPVSLPVSVKIIWAGIAYILWDTAYTICDVPIFGLITTITDDQNERVSLQTVGRMAALVGAFLVSMIVPMLKNIIGGWLPTTIVLAVIGIITMTPICLTAKERIKPKTPEKETTIKEMFSYLKQNKYMLIFFGSSLLMNTANVEGSLALYLARYCLGNEALMSMTSLLPMIPMLLVGFFIPALIRRVDKYYLYWGASCAVLVCTVIMYFVGYKSIPVYLFMLLLRGIPMGIVTMTSGMFTPDCAEYGFFKSGISAPGITFSLQTFNAKLVAALSTSLAAVTLTFIGFLEGADTVQVAGFADKLWFVTRWLPVVGVVIGLITLSFYKLRDKQVQVMAKCNAGEISRDEAMSALKALNATKL